MQVFVVSEMLDSTYAKIFVSAGGQLHEAPDGHRKKKKKGVF